MVQLTATASTGSRFVGWTGDCSGASVPLSLTLDEDRSCTAGFDLATPDLYPFLSATPNPGVAGDVFNLNVGFLSRAKSMVIARLDEGLAQ